MAHSRTTAAVSDGHIGSMKVGCKSARLLYFTAALPVGWLRNLIGKQCDLRTVVRTLTAVGWHGFGSGSVEWYRLAELPTARTAPDCRRLTAARVPGLLVPVVRQSRQMHPLCHRLSSWTSRQNARLTAASSRPSTLPSATINDFRP